MIRAASASMVHSLAASRQAITTQWDQRSAVAATAALAPVSSSTSGSSSSARRSETSEIAATGSNMIGNHQPHSSNRCTGCRNSAHQYCFVPPEVLKQKCWDRAAGCFASSYLCLLVQPNHLRNHLLANFTCWHNPVLPLFE